MNLRSRQRGCLLGLACGDAVGTTIEFSDRGSFPPVMDMVGGGPFRLPAGWRYNGGTRFYREDTPI